MRRFIAAFELPRSGFIRFAGARAPQFATVNPANSPTAWKSGNELPHSKAASRQAKSYRGRVLNKGVPPVAASKSA